MSKSSLSLQQLRALPKVELHRHLECSLRPSTLRELLSGGGHEVPPEAEAFAKMYLVTQPMDDLEAVLAKFLATQGVLSTEDVLERITYEAIEDAFFRRSANSRAALRTDVRATGS